MMLKLKEKIHSSQAITLEQGIREKGKLLINIAENIKNTEQKIIKKKS